MLSGRSVFYLAVMLLLMLFLFSCEAGEESFGIYLADSGELVLSEVHIKSYHSAENKFELNEQGIERWNSFINYQDVPKLEDSLFSREFMIKIEGKEICRGKFWSNLSSTLCPETVIADAFFKLDREHCTLTIHSGYPGAGQEAFDTAAIADFFKK